MGIRAGRLLDGTTLVVDPSDSWHAALQGMSRSGKSVLTYTLLASVAHRRDVVICGCDPTGILLNPWRDHPGAEYRAIRTVDMTRHLDVLSGLVAEMDRRIDWLLDHDMDKVGDPSTSMPLLWIVMEEFPGLISAAESDDEAEGRKPAERITPRIKRSVRRIVQEGAKAGLRLLLIAQRMDASIVGGAERSNLGLRMTMRVDNRDAVQMLHPRASDELIDASGLFLPGTGLVDVPGRGTMMFKADLLEYSDYVRHVRAAA